MADVQTITAIVNLALTCLLAAERLFTKCGRYLQSIRTLHIHCRRCVEGELDVVRDRDREKQAGDRGSSLEGLNNGEV